MVSRRHFAIVLLLALLGSACQTNSIEVAFEQPAAPPPGEPIDVDLYCTSLAEMLDAVPAGATTDAQAAAYADAAERAAAQAPEASRPTLEAIAQLSRNPQDSDAETVRSAFQGIGPIARFAEERCGLDSAAFTGSGSGSTSGSVSITVAADGATIETGDGEVTVLEPFVLVAPGTEPDRPVDPSADEQTVASQVNANVPGDFDVEFEWQEVTSTDKPYSLRGLVPIGWSFEESGLGSTFTFSDSEFSIWTELEFKAACQGSCEPKDWVVEVMDDETMSPFTVAADPDEITVLVRQELSSPTGRLVVYGENNGAGAAFAETVVVATRWSNEADRFFQCSVTLDGDDQALWPAFADACIAARPGWIS